VSVASSRHSMNQSIELHDSKLAAIGFADGRATIVFSPAYIHRSHGKPGRDPGTVWTQDAELIIDVATEINLPSSWPCAISDGQLQLNDLLLKNEIPIPLHHVGNVRLKLGLLEFNGNFKAVEVKGANARLRLLGEAKYLEEFSGS